MVIEIKKSQGTFQSFVKKISQFFHENCLFFEAFEIVIKTNAFFILFIFKKLKPTILEF